MLDWGYRPNVRQDHDHTNNLRSHEMDFSWPWPCGGTSALIRAIGGAHGGVSRLWRGFQLGNALGKGDDDVVLPAALFPMLFFFSGPLAREEVRARIEETLWEGPLYPCDYAFSRRCVSRGTPYGSGSYWPPARRLRSA